MKVFLVNVMLFYWEITHNYPQSYPEGAEMSILFLKIKKLIVFNLLILNVGKYGLDI